MGFQDSAMQRETERANQAETRATQAEQALSASVERAMSVQRILHCDAPDCDAHGAREHPGWLTVKADDMPAKHFCNGDCLFKWAGAHSEPPEIIPLAPEASDG
jgi:hypothetical protein